MISYQTMVDEVLKEFPDFEVVEKGKSRLMRVLDVAFRLLTLNKVRDFLTCSVTTLGSVVYVPDNWSKLPDSYRVSTLRHERIHLRQFAEHGLLKFLLLYLLFPLPVGIAWFRAKFEMEAYEESMRGDCEIYGDLTLRSRDYRKGIVDLFTGPAYAWMWPFRASVERWYDETAQRILRDRIANAETDPPPCR